MIRKVFPCPMVGIDIGATKTLTLVVNEAGEVVGSCKVPTLKDKRPDKMIEIIAGTVDKAIASSGVKKKRIGAVGVGAPAPIDIKKGIVYFATNLGWHNVPLKSKLEKLLGLQVFADNDVNMGTRGEYVLGAGRGTNDFVGFFVGTGIGGGIIINGKLVHGKNMTGGEVGHIIVIPDGPLCGCGNRGCLEAVSSRLAIVRDLEAGIKKGIPSVLNDMLKKTPGRIRSGMLRQAYKANDPLTVDVLNRAAHYLGLAIASTVNTLGPDRVVIGGGVFEAIGRRLLPIVRKSAEAHYFGPAGNGMDIALAALGDHAVALGAAATAAKKMK